jgi:hydrogenase maturation protein HypF
MTSARSIRVRGVVQGVGFRPFVFRLARANTLAGWVLNASEGVEIHLEGAESALDAFEQDLRTHPPLATQITGIDIRSVDPAGYCEFTIRESQRSARPSVRISPDLPVCDACLKELFDERDPRHHYPYINCTNCGPRYTIIRRLPYDRCNTTMKAWPLDTRCADQYRDPEDRRFHAQPVACPECGPHYGLRIGERLIEGDDTSIRGAVQLLKDGRIVAVKGLGGYHLACDAANEKAVLALRQRKFRKEKPFALMTKDLETARSLIHLSPESIALLCSTARPIVLAPAKMELPGVAPDNDEFGVMLPYTPLHYLLFACGAPSVLVMTSANRSNEPIAFEDEDALQRLSEIADAFLIGERPIARRVDDSIARAGAFGPVILRRARGYAPGAVASLPGGRPLLALGADLKNTITLVVGGQAFISQHIGDLDYYQSRRAFEETIHDLTSMYEVDWDDLLIVHDQHPEYVSTFHALQLPSPEKQAIQHHRAHLASVLAEHAAWDKRVLGVIFDGTGYGDDGAIWGGEIFSGSLAGGFDRVAHLRYSALAGGDAAARHPVQAAAGFVTQLDGIPDLTEAPFRFPARYQSSLRLLSKGLRTFPTTSMGRLFDTAAALLGFTREITFEGQAAMWLEHVARGGPATEPYPFPFVGEELDFRPLLTALIQDRILGRNSIETARSFQSGVAHGVYEAVKILCETTGTDTVVLSGGVFQNELLLEDINARASNGPIQLWTNRLVPANDGGISLGQAALASFRNFGSRYA